jgi:two-component system, cell cycle sensor histidine kinase and response regulator CckA
MRDDHRTNKRFDRDVEELRPQHADLKESITGNILAELEAEEARRYAESIVETVREPLLVLDADLKIISANRHFYTTFNVIPSETIGCFIYDLGNKQWDIPLLRELLEEILPEKQAFDDFEVAHDFQDIGHKVMLLNARQVYRKDIDARMILLAIEDITERKRLEALLTESEERFRRLFETANDGIVLLEKAEGKITHANPAAEKMLGYTTKESIGNKLQDIGVSLDLGDFQTTMENLNKNGMIKYDDVPVKTKAGQHIDTDIYLVDRARLVQCNIRDITERKRAEEALRQSEEKYRWVLDNMADVITVMDMNLRFTYVSPSIIRLRGYTAEEAVAQTFEQVMTPESLQISAKIFEEEMKLEASGTADPGRIRIVEVEQYRKDGSIVWMENHLSFMRDESQKPVGIISVSHDITERKRAEEEMNQTNIFLNAIIENIPNMVFLKDARDLRFVRFNRAGEELLGQSRDDLIGKNDYDFFPKMQADFFTEKDREVLFGQKLVDIGEESIQTRWGEKILHTKKLPILNERGEPLFLLGISEDITERKRADAEKEKLQAQLMQAQKMESVGRLAGGVAHDFNNKLTVILGYAQMAMEGVDKTEPLYENLQQIMNAGKQSVEIVRQLLAFARKQIIAPEVLDINETMEGMLKMLRRLIGEDIHLIWSPGYDLGEVKMDPSQVDQILANLCVNARDAIEGVGKVTIETRNTVLDEAYCAEHGGAEPGEYVMLSVSDNGCGMDRETQENIFEPFFTTKEVGKGTGLGLATVYGIVKQNNGFIEVASEPGNGTAFSLYLPRHGEKAEKEVKAVEAETPQSRGETILIVEDDVSVLHLTERILDHLGYAVLTSASPAEALTMVREYQGKIDLLMTDVILPEMSGMDLAGEMLKIRPTIRTLFMSGYTADIIARQGVLEKGVHFVQKPFTFDSLARKVREALGSEK